LFQAMGIDQNTLTTQRQTQDYQAKYQQVTAQFPDAPTSAENLRHTVEIAEQIRAGLRSPDAMFAIISHALDASPDIQLERLEWHYGDSTATKTGADPAATPTPGPGGLLQTGIVHGEVTRFAGDYRTAMSAINNFLQLIARDNAVAEVKVVKLPLDVSSKAGLTGSTMAIPGKETAEFEVAVIFKSGV
jgi:hypothetical protein